MRFQYANLCLEFWSAWECVILEFRLWTIISTSSTRLLP